VPGGAYGVWSGTSMAAPLATGAAALVLATRPPGGSPRRPPQRQWLAEDVLKRLEDRSVPLCNSPLKAIDAAAAVTDTPPVDPGC
jgi:subtilisin family serine protease